MFLFELQELVPFIFTIGLICTVSYACIAHLYCGVTEYWVEGGGWIAQDMLPLISVEERPISFILCRAVRRKESPDEDTSDCRLPLIAIRRINREDIHGEDQGIHRL